MEHEKIALVTGGAKGIGAAIVSELAQSGFRVVIGFKSSENGASHLSNELNQKGMKTSAQYLDLASEVSITNAVAEIEMVVGQIDVLVNNGAHSEHVEFLKMSQVQIQQMFEVNLKSAMQLAQLTIPKMVEKNWGRIINIASIGGQWGGKNQIHYATMKAGLIGFTRSLAKTYSLSGVLSNAVSPGLIDTEMTAPELSGDNLEAIIATIPVGRIGRPVEVAKIVGFLASGSASYISGQTINVNGGMLFS
jgi:NAD(P)-dependent dehydrogenase (short-subunit alcohol dehydrogenase family)